MQIQLKMLRLGARPLIAMAAMGVLGMVAGRAAAAAPLASGTISTTGTGALNSYTLTLNDAATSTTPIGSIWQAWVPGRFYMTSSPSNVTSPAGWTDNITSGGGGFAIQWIASSATFDLQPGGSLSGFGFQSPDAPSSIEGISSVVPGVPTETTVAYEAGLFSDSGTTFVFNTASAVPEPTTFALMGPAGLWLLRRRQLKRV